MKPKILSGIIAFITASGIFFPIVLWIEDLERKGEVFPEWTVELAAFSYFGFMFFIYAICLSYFDKDNKPVSEGS